MLILLISTMLIVGVSTQQWLTVVVMGDTISSGFDSNSHCEGIALASNLRSQCYAQLFTGLAAVIFISISLFFAFLQHWLINPAFGMPLQYTIFLSGICGLISVVLYLYKDAGGASLQCNLRSCSFGWSFYTFCAGSILSIGTAKIYSNLLVIS
jgi:hypothetical protein